MLIPHSVVPLNGAHVDEKRAAEVGGNGSNLQGLHTL